jgi:hypothetical protein
VDAAAAGGMDGTPPISTPRYTVIETHTASTEDAHDYHTRREVCLCLRLCACVLCLCL